MRLTRRPKNNFATLADKKEKTLKKSMDEKKLVQTLNQLDGDLSEAHFHGKYRGKSAKPQKNYSINKNIAINHSFLDLGKELKSKRGLIEQNNDLKKKLQNLSVSKNFKKDLISKKISTQFQKQMYWSGSQNYMISGIKLQYQKMKDSYHKKNDEYDLLLKSMEVCENMELVTYVEALEVENNILASGIENKFKRHPGQSYDEETSLSMIMWLREKLVQQESKVSSWKLRNRKNKLQMKQLKGKVSFLEKLLIQKDNNEHSAHRAAKRSEKEKDQLKQRLSTLELTIKTLKEDHERETYQIKKRNIVELQYEKQRLNDSHRELIDHVNRLQRENKYLHDLVTSWKEDKDPKEKGSSRKVRMQKMHSMPMDHQTGTKHNQFDNTSKKKLDDILPITQQEDELRQTVLQIKRIEPYTSDNKNSENAVKNRRVQPYQIDGVIDHGKFVLIAKGITLQELISQFDCQKEDQWLQEYINMGQVREILQENMKLKSQQALLLARYLIEHSENEHVYTDDLNEHNRTVVKSIIKNLLGDYPIYKEKKEKFDNLLIEWKTKLQFTLENTTKGGIISRDRFEDLLQSLQLKGIEGFSNYCVSKMILQSDSLSNLTYKLLLEDVPDKE